MDRQEEWAQALMAKLEKYRKRIHRRYGITTPCWRHSAYQGWLQFRTFVRETHSFGRDMTILGVSLPRRWVSPALLRRMGQVEHE